MSKRAYVERTVLPGKCMRIINSVVQFMHGVTLLYLCTTD
jgi:hypothetical protein